MTEPSRNLSTPRLGSDGRPEKPKSIVNAVQAGFVQAGLSALTTVAMLVVAAGLASATELAMGDAVWIIAVVQFVGVALLLGGVLRLRSGKTRALYFFAAGLQVVNCLCWHILDLAWSGNPSYAVVPVLLGILPVIGLVQAARPTSSEYLRIMRQW